jgi:hypothetical protein
VLGHRDAALTALGVEQAQLDPSACSLNSEKLVPRPSQVLNVAPSG